MVPRAGGARRGRPDFRPGGTFRDHIARYSGLSLGGIDYAPTQLEHTAICPVAAGVVVGAHNDSMFAGMNITVGHGLGWRTLYAHLDARFVDYRDQVKRREVVAWMGSSGWGARRGGMTSYDPHLHLTLWAPAYAPLFRGVTVQEWQAENQCPAPHDKSVDCLALTRDERRHHVMDPEAFSLHGKDDYLYYSLDEDVQHDTGFLAKHYEAVAVCDELLGRLGDADAAAMLKRHPWEFETRFDFRVDRRIWYLWQRLSSGQHLFSDDYATEHRARLLSYMTLAPRFTAPIVDPARREEYSMRRTAPHRFHRR